MSVFITGGAGFVGASLARRFRQRYPERRIAVFDNLRRRGAELNLAEFGDLEIEFVHGDIRCPEDLDAVQGEFELFVEASAEPSVHAGVDGDPRYLLNTNLTGTLNCLEFARQRCGGMVFLSTSRVYSIPALNGLPLEEEESRLRPAVGVRDIPGFSERGVAEGFDLSGFRSLYGASKLASELIIQEYCAFYDLAAVIDRCGVIVGPGQWGKVDQGVYTLWVANHFFGRPLRYIGYGGRGKQVRDLLHPDDLFSLLETQAGELRECAGQVFNAGGGTGVSTSLLEYTRLCAQITGRRVEIGSVAETSRVDVPYYVSDCARIRQRFGWRPEKTVADIVADIHVWLRDGGERVAAIFDR